MLGKEAIAQFLERNSIQYIFHLPGIHTLPVNETLGKSNLCVLMGRHESNIGFTADGYARATGRPGVLLVTPGPGLANVIAPCMEAYGDDVPLLIIHIDVNRKHIGKGVLHGVGEPDAIFGHITRENVVVTEPEHLMVRLENAYRAAASGRPGPVLVSIPYDLLERDVPLANETIYTREEPDEALENLPLDEVLKGKERPVIIGGKAAMGSGAGLLLEEVCRESHIPFLSTTSGKGLMREDNGIAFGNVIAKGVAREITKAADIAIALGTRLREVDTRRRGVKINDLVHIDVDDRWLGRNYRTRLKAVASMRKATEAVRDVLKGRRSSWDMEALRRSRERELSGLQKTASGFRIITLLRQVIPEDTITVWDLNLVSYWAEYYFPVFHERSFITPRGTSPIFYAFPASLGAKAGRPDAPCLCVVGDGSFAAVAGELATVRKYNLPVVILLYNNCSYGILEGYMRERYGLKGEMELVNPDFLGLAAAFDIPCQRAENPDEMKRIFLEDIHWDEPYLLELRYPIFPPPWE